ncbi:MAG: hypothetical protein ACREWE_12935 [Gammaproteobacteria bacterium]
MSSFAWSTSSGPHLNVFVNQLPIRDLRKRLSADDRIDILAALSGG